MTLEPTRRGFLAGLFGLTVVAVVPGGGFDEAAAAVPAADPFAIQAPEGITYQWVRTALLGEPDPANVEARLCNGWRFVSPSRHPSAPTAQLGATVEMSGLVLMERPTADVEAQERARQPGPDDMFKTGAVNRPVGDGRYGSMPETGKLYGFAQKAPTDSFTTREVVWAKTEEDA